MKFSLFILVLCLTLLMHKRLFEFFSSQIFIPSCFHALCSNSTWKLFGTWKAMERWSSHTVHVTLEEMAMLSLWSGCSALSYKLARKMALQRWDMVISDLQNLRPLDWKKYREYKILCYWLFYWHPETVQYH